MSEVTLKRLDAEGVLVYEEQEDGTVNYDVRAEDEGLIKDASALLEKEREFMIPESNVEDDYRVDKAVPTSGLTYFELALSTLYANTGIKVGW